MSNSSLVPQCLDPSGSLLILLAHHGRVSRVGSGRHVKQGKVWRAKRKAVWMMGSGTKR